MTGKSCELIHYPETGSIYKFQFINLLCWDNLISFSLNQHIPSMPGTTYYDVFISVPLGGKRKLGINTVSFPNENHFGVNLKTLKGNDDI